MARVLIVQLSRLGDVIQSTPLLTEWIACRPGDQIDVLVQEQNRRVLDGFPGLHQVRTLPDDEAYLRIAAEFAAASSARDVPVGAVELLKRLDLPRYATIVNVTYDLLSGWIVGRLAADRVVGGYLNRQGEHLFSGAGHVYLASLIGFRHLNWFNLVDLWRSAVDGAPVPSSDARPYVSVADRLPFSLPSGRIVALNPGSSSSGRRWPPSFFAQLAGRLNDAGFAPILVGAPSDQAVCADVAAQCRMAPPNYSGQTTVSQMARLLTEARLLVSVDTGAVHIASAVGTPVVGLYGATATFRETAPWGEGHVIVQAPLGTDLAELGPDLVYGACAYRLGLLDTSAFGQELADRTATAWQTFFLPAGADPLGGLGYRALHPQRLAVSDLFALALRQAFAAEFRKVDAVISLAWLRAGASGTARRFEASDAADELADMRDAVASTSAMLEDLARHASEAARLVRALTPRSSARLSAIGAILVGSAETLKSHVQHACGSQLVPVVQFLDCTFRMMPRLSPVETFRFQQRHYESAAARLKCAAEATAALFETP